MKFYVPTKHFRERFLTRLGREVTHRDLLYINNCIRNRKYRLMKCDKTPGILIRIILNKEPVVIHFNRKEGWLVTIYKEQK